MGLLPFFVWGGPSWHRTCGEVARTLEAPALR